MKRKERIDLLHQLGNFILEDGDDDMQRAIQLSYHGNNWFTVENCHAALKAIALTMLDKQKLEQWCAHYPTLPDRNHPQQRIALIMAGNIPLVGFHDWLTVFVLGERAVVKLSEKDKHLLPMLTKKLGEWAHESWEYTEYVPEGHRLAGFDKVIATGSNNTSRYFEQYFAKYPHIIRKHRNAIAILNGQETAQDIEKLGKDIFDYFGLGCRNVSKLYVPRDYNFEPLLELLHQFNQNILHNKYKNNFDYNFTLYILNSRKFMNNGCILLSEDSSLQSRIASLHYEHYDDIAHLTSLLQGRLDEIQCITGNFSLGLEIPVIPLGMAQMPELMDYPDGVDTMKFLYTV